MRPAYDYFAREPQILPRKPREHRLVETVDGCAQRSCCVRIAMQRELVSLVAPYLELADLLRLPRPSGNDGEHRAHGGAGEAVHQAGNVVEVFGADIVDFEQPRGPLWLVMSLPVRHAMWHEVKILFLGGGRRLPTCR